MKYKVIIMIFCMLTGFLIPSFGAKLPSHDYIDNQVTEYYDVLPSEQTMRNMDSYDFSTFDDEDEFPEGGDTDPEDGYNDAPIADGMAVLVSLLMTYAAYIVIRFKKRKNSNIK